MNLKKLFCGVFVGVAGLVYGIVVLGTISKNVNGNWYLHLNQFRSIMLTGVLICSFLVGAVVQSRFVSDCKPKTIFSALFWKSAIGGVASAIVIFLLIGIFLPIATFLNWQFFQGGSSGIFNMSATPTLWDIVKTVLSGMGLSLFGGIVLAWPLILFVPFWGGYFLQLAWSGLLRKSSNYSV